MGAGGKGKSQLSPNILFPQWRGHATLPAGPKLMLPQAPSALVSSQKGQLRQKRAGWDELAYASTVQGLHPNDHATHQSRDQTALVVPLNPDLQIPPKTAPPGSQASPSPNLVEDKD